VVLLLAVSATASAAGVETRVMASRHDGTFRADLVASRDGADASVFVRAYDRAAGRWRLLDSRRVARRGSFAWASVGHPGAVRKFSVDGRRQRIGFELLITPAVGWSQPYLYRVVEGKLAGGLQLCGCAPG
jgi:hypothetical protein